MRRFASTLSSDKAPRFAGPAGPKKRRLRRKTEPCRETGEVGLHLFLFTHVLAVVPLAYIRLVDARRDANAAVLKVTVGHSRRAHRRRAKLDAFTTNGGLGRRAS